MTPRPFHRWKSFWLGILIACFLGWAWWDSLRFESSVTWHRFTVTNASGAIFIVYGSQDTASPELSWARSDPNTFIYITLSAFVPPGLLRGGDEDPGNLWAAAVSSESPAVYHEVAIEGMRFQPRGDWLILLAFVLPWSGFLIWRGRRMKRLS
jgi:hypothetical protein